MRKQFTGYERDNETTLDFAQARMFLTTSGRFTTADPAMVSASVQNPQSWNRYVYVLNSPYRYTDPLGLWADPIINYKNVLDKEGRWVVESVSVTVKMEEGDNAKSLAKQLKISEKDAAKLIGKMDKDGNIQLSKAEGRLGSVFKNIESRILAHENSKLKNPSRNNDQGWDCSKTSGMLAGFDPLLIRTGANGIDDLVTARGSSNERVFAENILSDNLRSGDLVRYAKPGMGAEHWATFLMLNSSGEPIVFSKSGMKGPNEIGTADDIAVRNGYGKPTGAGEDSAPYYRKLANSPMGF